MLEAFEVACEWKENVEEAAHEFGEELAKMLLGTPA